jgi:hypothetical protein
MGRYFVPQGDELLLLLAWDDMANGAWKGRGGANGVSFLPGAWWCWGQKPDGVEEGRDKDPISLDPLFSLVGFPAGHGPKTPLWNPKLLSRCSGLP